MKNKKQKTTGSGGRPARPPDVVWERGAGPEEKNTKYFK